MQAFHLLGDRGSRKCRNKVKILYRYREPLVTENQCYYRENQDRTIKE
jgi:hypothetical protein